MANGGAKARGGAIGRSASEREAIGARGIGSCGGGVAIELLPVGKGWGEQKEKRQKSYALTAEERGLIEAVKERHPEYRHRRIQGILQQQGMYLSASAICGYLKRRGSVEPYER